MQEFPNSFEPIPAQPMGYGNTVSQVPWQRSPRFRLFAVVLFLCLAAGLGYTLSQPAIYESRASLLVSAMTAVDQSSAAPDIQHVAIQRQVLLGNELINRTRDRLDSEVGYDLTRPEIREIMQVEQVPDTNLVEMVARGERERLLPLLINTWTEVYLAARAAEITQSTDNTTRIVSSELDALNQKIETARVALDDFRREHNIISAQREENAELNQLRGLNQSLNDAVDVELRAQGRLETVQARLARGELVIAGSQRDSMKKTQGELQRLNAQLKELERTYTREYIDRHPRMQRIPERIALLETRRAAGLAESNQLALEEAEEAYAAAARTTAKIRERLEQQREKVTVFTTIFAEHETLESDLANLEEIHRATLMRLTQIESSQLQKYPQVKVIDPASEATMIGPPYLIYSLIVLAGSVFTALFAVWLSSWLNPTQKPPNVMLSGVHMYPTREALAYQQAALAQQQNPALEQQHIPALQQQAEPAAEGETGQTADSETGPAADSETGPGDEDANKPRTNE